MNNLILYHGSYEIVEKPKFGIGKTYNDYGRGFYCTKYIEYAREWACDEKDDGFVSKYFINLSNIKVLNLLSEKYSILHGIALLMVNRKIRFSSIVMKYGYEWITEHFMLDVEDYDIIVGYRADDSYLTFLRSFINNEISLNQLYQVMGLGKCVEEVVIKSKKAFDDIKFLSYEILNPALSSRQCK